MKVFKSVFKFNKKIFIIFLSGIFGFLVLPQIASAATINFSGSPTTVSYGGSATLTWNTVGVLLCTASASPANTQWSGTKGISGSQTITGLTQTTIFSLTCNGEKKNVAINIATPTLTFSASPTSVSSGGSATLSWSSTNATSCLASGGWSGTKDVSGYQHVSNLTATTTFTLTCSGAGGSATKSATVTVTAATFDFSLSLSSSSGSVSQGGSVNTTATITLTSGTAQSVTLSTSGLPVGVSISFSLGVNNPTYASSIIITSTSASSAGTYNFTITATGGGKTKSANYSLTVTALAPTLTFTASPTSVYCDIPTTLTWSSTNATSCTASGGWSGDKNTSGSQEISGLAGNTTFYLSCAGTGGSITKNVTVSVITSPSLTLSASPTSVGSGDSTTLTWATNYVCGSCTASASPSNSQWSGSKAATCGFHSQAITNLTGTTTFSLTCVGTTTSTTKSVEVTVTTAPTLTLSASPTSVGSGDSTTLTWASANVTSCSATASPSNSQWTGSKTASGTHSQVITSLTAATTFSLTCTGTGGSITKSVEVTVGSGKRNRPFS